MKEETKKYLKTYEILNEDYENNDVTWFNLSLVERSVDNYFNHEIIEITTGTLSDHNTLTLYNVTSDQLKKIGEAFIQLSKDLE